MRLRWQACTDVVCMLSSRQLSGCPGGCRRSRGLILKDLHVLHVQGTGPIFCFPILSAAQTDAPAGPLPTLICPAAGAEVQAPAGRLQHEALG